MLTANRCLFCLWLSLLPMFDDTLFFSTWGPDHPGVNRFLRSYFMMGGSVGRHQTSHASSEFLYLSFAGLLQLTRENVKNFGRLMDVIRDVYPRWDNQIS